MTSPISSHDWVSSTNIPTFASLSTSSSQGGFLPESPFDDDSRKRPNTAPESTLEKSPSLTESNFFETGYVDDESHFVQRTISPIYGGPTSYKYRNRINSLSSQDSGIFSDILSPDSSQFDSYRSSCTSPNDSKLIFSAATDLRLDAQHSRQTSAPETITTHSFFPIPPRRSKLITSRCTQTHPYRLPSKSPSILNKSPFFSPKSTQSFKRPLTPLPRIGSSLETPLAFQTSQSQTELASYNLEDNLPISFPSIFPNSPFSSSTPAKPEPNDTISSDVLSTSPAEDKVFPLSQASIYHSLEDLPSLNDGPMMSFSDVSTTRITSNYPLLPRSCTSVSSGSRSSSEESLLYHTPEKEPDKKFLDPISSEKLSSINLFSKYHCHEIISSQVPEFPPIVTHRQQRQTNQQHEYLGKYRITDQIGSGTYGHVQKAWDPDCQRYVAIKTFVNHEPYRGIPQHTYREIRTFQFKSHPGLLESIEVIQTENGPCGFPLLHLVTEFIDQDLKVYIEKSPHLLVEQKIKSIMVQLSAAIGHLNWVLRIMHRDLKPANILISHNGVVKIADFGMAKHYKYLKLLTPHVVTLWYRAPEILMNCAYDFAVDVWSLGCIFAELYNKFPFFEGTSEITQLSLIISRIGLPPRHKWSSDSPVQYDQFRNNACLPLHQFIPTAPVAALQGVEAMLEFDPETRIKSDKLDSLNYFK
ncbi:Cyclin-dependent kinase 4 [Oopsacas minuta]|uniref:Cyclin-dependent kinase 4 n=1 Tax=Oopsacas minuta TaxID=111878 RepID=A0AAV7JEI1_9METZ|nr:Cyclin-dependent kinase 4 [Oopsacas minuta]